MLQKQNAALIEKLKEAQVLIGTFPQLITSARLDAKQNKPTKYNYNAHNSALLIP